MNPRAHGNKSVGTRPIAVALLCAAAIAGACDARARRTPDDTVVILLDTAVTNIDPRYTGTNNDTKFSGLVAPGLTATDTDDQRARNYLAADLHQVDELTWEATVRDDVRFSDGTPVTAADVAWTFNSMLAEGSDSNYAQAFRERLTGVEVTGERTVRFHLVKPLATFTTDLDFGILAQHAADASGHFAGGRVIGAGPYRLVSIDPDRIVLEANPYCVECPHEPRLDARVVPDASARIVMLVGGSADLAQNTVRPDLVADVAAEPRLALASAPSSLLTYLMMNNDDPVLADKRVRQAIALAIDRRAIVDVEFGGRAVIATGLLRPGHWAYNGDVARWEHDPARAEALLDAAGYPVPPGGGPRLHLVYKTSADQFRVAVARIIASQLGQVGIDVEVRPFEFGTFFDDIKKGQFQLASMQTTDIGEPDLLRSYFNSGRIPNPKEPTGQNRWRYRNPRVDELTEQGRRVVDLDARKKIYGEVQAILAEDLPVIPLWHEDNVVLSNRDVTGFRILPNGRFNGLVTVEKR